MASKFSMKMNGVEFRKIIAKKREGIEENVEVVVKTTAKDVRTTLFSNTPKADTFTAIRTVKSQKVDPRQTRLGFKLIRDIGGVGTRALTSIGGRARAAFTNSPMVPGDAIFKVEKFVASIGSRVPHMKFLEDGTRAHGPKTAKFLVFPTKDGVVFTKWVKGIRPMKIFKKTNLLYSRIFPKRIEAAVKKGLER